MPITVTRARLDGVLSIVPMAHADERGFFLQSFHRDEYHDAGIDVPFVQDNHSRSVRGTVRALHFQVAPGQPKLVSVTRGSVYDVVVDLRRSSPTFGQWESIELDDVEHRQIFIPVGFAHGFCALSTEVDVVYKVGSYYDPTTERGLAWDDPDLAIPWPTDRPLVSERDRANPTLSELTPALPDW